MNITRVLALISLLLFLVPKFVSTMTKSSFWVLFFFINLFFLAIWLGGLISSDQDCDSFSYLPPLVLEEDYQLPEVSKDEDCNIRNNEDFLPCLVFEEYEREKPLLLECSDDDDDDDGFQGYDEDNDEDGGGDDNDASTSSEDEGEEDLKRRFEEKRKFEEFIAKTKKKWKEELLNDKLLCIAAGT